jgi:hypothetical protein
MSQRDIHHLAARTKCVADLIQKQEIGPKSDRPSKSGLIFRHNQEGMSTSPSRFPLLNLLDVFFAGDVLDR